MRKEEERKETSCFGLLLYPAQPRNGRHYCLISMRQKWKTGTEEIQSSVSKVEVSYGSNSFMSDTPKRKKAEFPGLHEQGR